MIKTSRYRDLSITQLPNGYLVIACDSNGSIGEKDGDYFPCPTEVAGMCAARVPLMEILSFGAQVININNIVCCEMEPTGRRVLDGIKKELEKINVSIEAVNGSSEENMPTCMTAIGVTVVGYTDELPKMNNVKSGDILVIVGKMKVGPEFFEGDENEMATYEDIFYLRSLPYVKEIVPLGSKGVIHEATLLAEYNNLLFKPNESGIDLHRSAGPATALVAVVEKEYAEELVENEKINIVGEFVSMNFT